ncbi:hypothetical protein [Vibrio alginolyticus]|nr:hypothetical protein [Vibrio alginolyticus]
MTSLYMSRISANDYRKSASVKSLVIGSAPVVKPRKLEQKSTPF